MLFSKDFTIFSCCLSEMVSCISLILCARSMMYSASTSVGCTESLFALLQPQHHAEKPVYFCLQLRTEPPKTTDNDRPFHRRQFVHP